MIGLNWVKILRTAMHLGVCCPITGVVPTGSNTMVPVPRNLGWNHTLWWRAPIGRRRFQTPLALPGLATRNIALYKPFFAFFWDRFHHFLEPVPKKNLRPTGEGWNRPHNAWPSTGWCRCERVSRQRGTCMRHGVRWPRHSRRPLVA